MTTKKILPLAAMEIVLKAHGAERVSEKAKKQLKDVLEDIAEKIALDSVKLAAHARRKTVKGRDIRLASENSY